MKIEIEEREGETHQANFEMILWAYVLRIKISNEKAEGEKREERERQEERVEREREERGKSHT
jgi:hypothetical protein